MVGSLCLVRPLGQRKIGVSRPRHYGGQVFNVLLEPSNGPRMKFDDVRASTQSGVVMGGTSADADRSFRDESKRCPCGGRDHAHRL